MSEPFIFTCSHGHTSDGWLAKSYIRQFCGCHLEDLLRSMIDRDRWWESYENLDRYYLPTPPLGQDMTQGQFLSGV